MGQTSEKPQEVSVIKALRQKRDVAMDRWAKITLRVTSSDAYQRASAAIGKPGLVLAAVARHKAEAAMAQILSHVNMPSRADVLSLSVRLTHIETALDDLGAALDQMRAAATKAEAPVPAKPPGKASAAKGATAKRATRERGTRATAKAAATAATAPGEATVVAGQG